MKKILRIVILVVLIAAMVVGGLFVFRDKVPNVQTYATRAWAATGRTDLPDSVSYMHYSNTDLLSTVVEKPDATVALVPPSGYVYVFAPETGNGLNGLMLVFVNEDGKVLTSISYSNLQSIFDGTGYAQYLNAANYVTYLYIAALDTGTAMTGDERVGQWYTFTDKQLKSILSAS